MFRKNWPEYYPLDWRNWRWNFGDPSGLLSNLCFSVCCDTPTGLDLPIGNMSVCLSVCLSVSCFLSVCLSVFIASNFTIRIEHLRLLKSVCLALSGLVWLALSGSVWLGMSGSVWLWLALYQPLSGCAWLCLAPFVRLSVVWSCLSGSVRISILLGGLSLSL